MGLHATWTSRILYRRRKGAEIRVMVRSLDARSQASLQLKVTKISRHEAMDHDFLGQLANPVLLRCDYREHGQSLTVNKCTSKVCPRAIHAKAAKSVRLSGQCSAF